MNANEGAVFTIISTPLRRYSLYTVGTISLKVLNSTWKAGKPMVVRGEGRQPSSSAGYAKSSHKGDDSCRQQLQPQ